jgi:hypothetical protein
MPNILNLNNPVQPEVNNEAGLGVFGMFGQGANENLGFF